MEAEFLKGCRRCYSGEERSKPQWSLWLGAENQSKTDARHRLQASADSDD